MRTIRWYKRRNAMRANSVVSKKNLTVDDDEMHLQNARVLIQDDQIEVITHPKGFDAFLNA